MKIILHHFRFNSDIDSLTGYKTKTMMCSPIKDQQGAVIGVAQVMMDFGIIFYLNSSEIFLLYWEMEPN